ncbi:GspE/PulE family protein [Desulfatiferula olefinivorans]
MFSDKDVFTSLIKHGLLTKDQARDILQSRERVRDNPTSKKKTASVSGDHPPTIIDYIAGYGVNRADRPLERLDEDLIFETLAGDWGVPYLKIDPLKLDLKLVTSTVHKIFAMKNLLLPLERKEGALVVATPDPFNREALDDLKRVVQMDIRPVVSSKSDIIKYINEFFGFQKSIAAAENQFSGPAVDLGNLEQYVKLKSMDELPSTDHHIINAVNHLFSYAFDQRASDIHIEPMREVTHVRMRIDGMLHVVYTLPKKVHNAMVSRIKALSRMDMAEKRRPQDGRIKTDKDGVEVEIRVSTVPIAFGEKVVMRVLHPDSMFQDLPALGFSESALARYEEFIKMPHGIILVCGPTGSGKSTTLYSTLRTLASPAINITTVEDPIEMVHEGFNQIAVQPAVGITFGTILRNILRQDPDVIMIGETRDLETAENAAQAAMTGHLVFSTLHTNDAASAITRLLDLGIPSYIIQACLVGVMGQRLVRKICDYCREPFEIDAETLRGLSIETGQSGSLVLHRGRGCVKCRGTGYRGRLAIFEILKYSETIREMTTPNADVAMIKKKAVEEGMVTLRQDAVRKMLKGLTTYEEVLRVTWGAE